MNKPKMILFDYGQTLVKEKKFDCTKGTEAVLKYTVKNEWGYTAEDVQKKADEMNHNLGRLDPSKGYLTQIEVPNYMFTNYLYESMGIELSLTPQETDKVFWDAACPGNPTDGIEDFLSFLKGSNIRTGVISNVSICGNVVRERINNLLPENNFEFIIPTSEYLFRKPNKMIFELALGKANLTPAEVWYIGDNYECDIVGAKNAGLFPVWYVGAITSISHSNEDILTISNWSDLKMHLS